MDTASNFPSFADSANRDKIADLRRLMQSQLTDSMYMNGVGAAQLLATLLRAYQLSSNHPRWEDDEFLRITRQRGQQTHLVLAAAFDLVANIEYYHTRVVSSNWIYCHKSHRPPSVYYSYLKQCPRCCLDTGLESRLSGAQHKPSSHHIGEITTTISALLLRAITAASPVPLTIASITKQSHDVDAIAFNLDTLLLCEIKSSPMVTYPLIATLGQPLRRESDGNATEYKQHSLIDLPLDGRDVGMYIPHHDLVIPLGHVAQSPWPYPAAIARFSDIDIYLSYLSAWLELYYAYAVPKTQRDAKQQTLTYLVNGWGDEIDSNKTKPGLGRTDDIKKGTYQLLKFGAYYRDDTARTTVRGILVANLDPLFLRALYIEKLADVRWGLGKDFIADGDSGFRIDANRLRFLYDGIVTFNAPLLNDPVVRRSFDLPAFGDALIRGELSSLLTEWSNARY